ncbi:hypothetical protein CP532_4337 [Ophiocordyceps camponoti-leonardi (nom. inval.)]|nr:hypothetical protein CP532_4337 [Ophiocordyceps camponoti-leonardi (nom. inval.)]
MSQVKNLRAMFENTGDRSPSERGRSPVAPTSSSLPATGSLGHDSSESPRPLSKIRTNFVPINKGGCRGIRREQSQESNMSASRMSTEMDVKSASTSVRRPDDDASHMHSFDTCQTLQTPLDAAKSPKAPSVESTQRPKMEALTGDRATGGPNSPASLPEPKSDTKDRGAEKLTLSSTARPKAGGYRGKNSTDPLSTTSKSPKQQVQDCPISNRSHSKLRATTSPTRILDTETTMGEGDGRPVKRASGGTIDKTVSTAMMTNSNKSKTRPAVSAKSKQPQTSERIGPSEPGHVKSKPKPLTNPTKVPATLVAQTSSSKVKGRTQGQSSSRESGSSQSQNPPRSFARASSSLNMTSRTGPTPSGQPHNRMRSSVGPPLPTDSSETDPSVAKHPNLSDSFLARMTRPTQASTSKTTEKTILTPPKKRLPKPAPRNERRGNPRTRALSGFPDGSHSSQPSKRGHSFKDATQSPPLELQSSDRISDDCADAGEALAQSCSETSAEGTKAAASPETALDLSANPPQATTMAPEPNAEDDSSQAEHVEGNASVAVVEGGTMVQSVDVAEPPECDPLTASTNPGEVDVNVGQAREDVDEEKAIADPSTASPGLFDASIVATHAPVAKVDEDAFEVVSCDVETTSRVRNGVEGVSDGVEIKEHQTSQDAETATST